MKSNVLLPGLLGLMVIGGGVYFFMQNSAPESVSSTETQTPTRVFQGQESAPTTVVLAQNAEFTYEMYSESAFSNLLGKEDFAVFVYSKSCGTCAKKDKQILDEIEQFTDGEILKLEYETAPQNFIETYAVTKYDTFVIFNADGSFETIKGAKVEAVRDSIQ